MADPWRIEAWTEYGIGVLVLLLRYFARWKAVGFKGWEGDDFVALFVLVCWTIVVYMLDQIVRHGTNRGITDEIGASLTSEQIARLEFGSKCLVVGRNFYVALIWSLKACILCFYNRIVRGLRQQVFVKWAGVACVFAYAGVMAAIWADCTPARKHWQVVPYPGDECTLSKTYYVVLLVLNVTTDIAIVSIPFLWLPMLRITLSRKIAIGVLVCSGVFIIIAAILRCVLTMLDLASIYITCMWAVREPFVAIIAVNAPVIKPLFSKSRWFTSRNGGSPTPGSQNHDSSSLHNLRGPDTINSTPKSVFNRSADTADMELGENSLEYNTWLKNEISASSSSIGESNCGADAKGITVATSTRVEVSPGKPGHIVGTTDTQIS